MLLHAQSLQRCFVSILQEPVYLRHIGIVLKAAAHYACIYKLARTVVHLALTHIDNTLAQGVRGFFQLFDFAGQLRLGLSEAGHRLLSFAVHSIDLG